MFSGRPKELKKIHFWAPWTAGSVRSSIEKCRLEIFFIIHIAFPLRIPNIVKNSSMQQPHHSCPKWDLNICQRLHATWVPCVPPCRRWVCNHCKDYEFNAWMYGKRQAHFSKSTISCVVISGQASSLITSYATLGRNVSAWNVQLLQPLPDPSWKRLV